MPTPPATPPIPPHFASTRSHANEDAHRDFDGWNAEEEIRRFRAAVKARHWHAAALLAANLDEFMSRGGARPGAWSDEEAGCPFGGAAASLRRPPRFMPWREARGYLRGTPPKPAPRTPPKHRTAASPARSKRR